MTRVNEMRATPVFFLILCAAPSFAISIEFFYGEGCPHCASTNALFESMQQEYNLSITRHEIYYDSQQRGELLAQYDRFGYDINKGGVPTILIEDKMMIVGGMDESQWRQLFDACARVQCPSGVFTQSTFSLPSGNQTILENNTMADPIRELNGAGDIALPVLIGAALVDSLNPCTIAVMVLLCGAIMASKGRAGALASGVVFSLTIFFMYMLYGLGIMRAITAFELTSAFYGAVTLGALVLAVMELNAYFNYRPGFLAVEMPLFIRPYAKKAAAGATSPLGVAVAAMLCSIFLLPCSSGPYLLVLGMLAKAATIKTLGYLVLYNAFFILPMLGITVAIYLGMMTVERVDAIKEEQIRNIHLASGIILLALFFIMLGQATGWY